MVEQAVVRRSPPHEGDHHAADWCLGQVELDERVAAHQRWLDLDGGEQLALDGADLRHLVLKGARLALCELRDCDLTGVDLGGTDLHRAYVLGCRLDGASLRRTDLRKTELVEVSARQASFETAYAPDVQLRRVDLRGTTFRRAYLLSASFDDADLRGAELEEVDCDLVSFAGCVFEESRISSVFRGAAGRFLHEEVVLSGSTGRRRTTTTELVDRARARPTRVSMAEASDVSEGVAPWRWGQE